MDMKLEVVVLPVSDADRAKAFYQGLGWRLDADSVTGPDFRVVQMTPPGSACAVMPGRATSALAVYDSLAGLADALRRAEAPNWPDWYAQYLVNEPEGQVKGEGEVGGT
jgi:catechol 2,3-dioxygenase-like lactoylglutathione lyase family enzyme